MGTRGPVRQPVRLKIISTPDAAEVEAETLADEVPPVAPDKPDGMQPAEHGLWDAIVPQLEALGLVSRVDGLTLDLAFRHYLAALQASDELAEQQSVAMEDTKNDRMQKHPADAVFRLHSDMFLKYAGVLGMSFVSRARLAARGGSDDEDDNPFNASAAAATGGS